MSSNYGLYQTLENVFYKKDLTAAQKNKLIQKIKELNHKQQTALFRLICEYAKINDGFIFQNNEHIPYEGEINPLSYDLSKLPVKLRWMVWKFVDALDSKEMNEFYTNFL